MCLSKGDEPEHDAIMTNARGCRGEGGPVYKAIVKKNSNLIFKIVGLIAYRSV